MTDAPETEGQAISTDSPALPSFDRMPLSGDVKTTLAEMGYTHPTPVQHAIYDPAIRGSDLVVQARTGTGKTAAFGIPLVDQMVKRSVPAAQALILAPTRELALQVSRELTRIGAKREVRIAAVYGGAPMQRQIDAIRAGAQIVVGTPGRVLDHLKRGSLDGKTIRILVLDEADEMLSMGFERELNAILEYLPRDRQTLLFSATLPTDIMRISKERLRDPQFVTLSGDHVGALDVTHFVYLVREEKTEVLLRILETENPDSGIIFCNTRDETERVAQALTKAGFDADWLNGDLPQSDRERIMLRTREGKLRFLVATDVAARGIDISHLTHVINYDFPESPEQYVHRTGRTGRMGQTGTAINLILPQDIGALYILRLTYKIRPFEKQIPTSGELKTRAETDLIQVLAEAFTTKPADKDDVALARRLLTHDRVELIIAGLLRDHLGERSKAQEEAAAARRSRAPDVAVEAPPVTQPQKSPEPLASRDPRRHRERPIRDRVEEDSSPARRPSVDNRPDVDRGRASAPRRSATADSGSRAGDQRHHDEDLDLPGYEVTALPPDDHKPLPEGHAAAPAEQMCPDVGSVEPGPLSATIVDESSGSTRTFGEPGVSHATFVDWSPPVEENDDEPILEGIGDGALHATEPEIPQEEQIELFVNAGRRDNARPEDFLRALEGHGVRREQIGRVRIRDRHTFLIVHKTQVQVAISALNGARIGTKTAVAEIAKPKGA